MTTSGYFSNNNRGEIPELQEELNSIKQDHKREAVKKVIAAMTVGKDVSSLFPTLSNAWKQATLS
jgi:vesicle coat complex subunit